MLFAVLLPAISAFAILYRQSSPFPFQDDYAVILNFADSYNQLPTLPAKLLDVAQTIEYKIIFEHFIVASEFALTHHRADPKDNSPMIDQNLLKGFPEERPYEQEALTNAIQKHIYILPAKQEPR